MVPSSNGVACTTFVIFPDSRIAYTSPFVLSSNTFSWKPFVVLHASNCLKTFHCFFQENDLLAVTFLFILLVEFLEQLLLFFLPKNCLHTFLFFQVVELIIHFFLFFLPTYLLADTLLFFFLTDFLIHILFCLYVYILVYLIIGNLFRALE